MKGQDDEHEQQDVEVERLNKPNDSSPIKTTTPERSALRGLLLALASEFCLATSNVFMKKTQLFSDLEQALVRYLIQFLVMLVIIRVRNLEIISSTRSIRAFLLLRGALGTAAILFTMRSLQLIDPSDTIALVNLNVILVPILARFFLPNERLKLVHFLSLPVILTG